MATWKVAVSSGIYGASEGTRTLDLRFTKPMLYQLSYAGLLPQPKRNLQIIVGFVGLSRQLGLGREHLNRIEL